MRVVSQRVVRPAEEQFKVRDLFGSGVDDHGVCRDITQALVFWGKQTTDAAHRIESGQQINDSQKVPDHDLGRAQPESFGIDHPNFEYAFSECLAAQERLEKDRITDTDNKITDCSRCQSEVWTDNGGKQKNLGKSPGNKGDSSEVNGKGQETSHRTGKMLGKTDAVR